ncbi:hypothetical protein D3C78_1365610 [compost metagenome]
MVAAKVVAQAVAAAGLAVAQQRAGAFQPQPAVVGVQRLAWLAGLFAVRLPAQQWRQAGAEELTVQRAFGIALDVNHGGRAGDQVFQPRTRCPGLQFLGLQRADIEQKTLNLPALHLACPL